jgi:Kef-type K+ transport system membrane component KefB
MVAESEIFLSAIIAVALLLFGAKLLAELFARFHLPVVLGELTAGIILGPLYLGGFVKVDVGIIEINELVLAFGQVGAIVILFVAGLEMPFRDFLRGGVSSFTTGTLGVIVPFFAGYLLLIQLGFDEPSSLIVGTALTATSIAVSVETLRELGRLNTKEGRLVIGAAVVDDVLAIAVLSVVISIIGGKTSAVDPFNLALVVGQVLFMFGVLLGLSILIVPRLTATRLWKTRGSVEAVSTSLFFGMAAVAAIIGLSPIVGAFAVGMALAGAHISELMQEYVEKLQFIFRPLFFAIVGSQVDLSGITPEIAVLGIALIGVAIISKLIGCGIPAAFFFKDRQRGMVVGVAMISRGEVGLIVGGLAIASGAVSHSLYSVIVLMIVATTVITPLWLKRTSTITA